MRDQQFVSFLMDDHLFGVDILVVREIIRNVVFTPVEHAPKAVRGLLNLRGQIITVLDLGPTLGLEPRGHSGQSRCIILKTADETARLYEDGIIKEEMHTDAIGLLVDGISDVVKVEEDGIDRPPANAHGLDPEHLSGVIKLENKLMMVLGLKSLVDQGLAQTITEQS
jgi:purine-binding chemotaxis protein CheW|nr:chemotaxis protein CheW [Candidatus Krumholzibacteria bacterium]